MAWPPTIVATTRTAFQLFRPLADQGVAEAQFNLGLMYDGGHGLPQNQAEAVRWYRKAADQGSAHAQYNLGVKYDHGEGVPQDDAEAVRWYRQAADQGFANAQYNLGAMYEDGQGVPKDNVQAYKWFDLAAARFSASESETRNQAVSNRGALAKMMTPAQIAEAQRLARDWKPK